MLRHAVTSDPLPFTGLCHWSDPDSCAYHRHDDLGQQYELPPSCSSCIQGSSAAEAARSAAMASPGSPQTNPHFRHGQQQQPQQLHLQQQQQHACRASSTVLAMRMVCRTWCDVVGEGVRRVLVQDPAPLVLWADHFPRLTHLALGPCADFAVHSLPPALPPAPAPPPAQKPLKPPPMPSSPQQQQQQQPHECRSPDGFSVLPAGRPVSPQVASGSGSRNRPMQGGLAAAQLLANGASGDEALAAQAAAVAAAAASPARLRSLRSASRRAANTAHGDKWTGPRVPATATSAQCPELAGGQAAEETCRASGGAGGSKGKGAAGSSAGRRKGSKGARNGVGKKAGSGGHTKKEDGAGGDSQTVSAPSQAVRSLAALTALRNLQVRHCWGRVPRTQHAFL